MKPNLKVIAILLCLHFVAATTFAQNTQINKKAFIGIWELSQAAANGQALQDSPHGLIKILMTIRHLVYEQYHGFSIAVMTNLSKRSCPKFLLLNL